MRVFLFLVAIVFTLSSTAQDESHIIKENDQIIISYKVLQVKKKGALIPEIRIAVENKDAGYVTASFILNFHYDMVLVEATEVPKLCIAPGKTKQGKIKGLFYNPQDLTYEQLQSFDVEINAVKVKVKKVENCK